jgi:AraC-like DNA-binding protein
MNFFEKDFSVSKISVALFLPGGSGTPIHPCRPTHGIVLNIGCSSTYSFEGGEVLTCGDGECIYLPRGSNYTAQRLKSSDIEGRGVYVINFLIADDDGTLFPPMIIKPKSKDELLSYFSRSENAWQRQGVGDVEKCFACLYSIIGILKRERTSYTPKEKFLARLAPALEYINNRYTSENISIAALANMANVSEVYLRRMFDKAFSVSPAIYIRNKRLNYARELLLSGSLSVTDAAYLSGFNDVAYFSREFRNYFGTPPSKLENA